VARLNLTLVFPVTSPALFPKNKISACTNQESQVRVQRKQYSAVAIIAKHQSGVSIYSASETRGDCGEIVE